VDPITAAAVDMLRTNAADLRAAVTGLDPATLNRPPVPDSSTLAILVEHATTAAIAQVEAAITGRMDRGHYMGEIRPAAFATTDADERRLHAAIDRLDAVITRLEQSPPAEGYVGDVAMEPPGEQARSRAWSLIHAVEHLREHVGHAQLTRQVFETYSEARTS
jgi:hypothetical protein